MPARTSSPYELPPNLPAPTDDGAVAHLVGRRIPSIRLQTTSAHVDFADATRGRTVVFFYPRTGVPGQAPNLGFAGEDWDTIPGARGCTPQSCAFRDLHAEFAAMGVRVIAISTSTPEHQAEFIARNHIPFETLSDHELRLVRTMGLPTFDFPVESGGPNTLIRRMAWYVENSVIHKVWYPVFPPNRNAPTVLDWLKRRGTITTRPIAAADLAYIRAELTKHWGSPVVHSRGVPFQCDALPGFIGEVDGAPAGQITLAFSDEPRSECEIITLSAAHEDRGVGAALLFRAFDEARTRACRRVFLTTSNDNTRAMAFYQRRGMRISAVYPGMIDRYREKNPAIPRVAPNGVPIRDEIELELTLA